MVQFEVVSRCMELVSAYYFVYQYLYLYLYKNSACNRLDVSITQFNLPGKTPRHSGTQDAECHSFITWLQSGNGFVITNISGFIEHVLPTYFKHSNFSSFVRQLNMYGFNKIRNNRDGDHIYQNRNFKRGSKSSIRKIQRKVNSDYLDKSQQLTVYQSRALAVSNTSKTRQIQRLQKNQVELQKKATSLLERNRELQLQNQQIMNQIEQQQQRKHSLIAQIIQVLNSVSYDNQNEQQSVRREQKHSPEKQKTGMDQSQEGMMAKNEQGILEEQANNLIINTKQDDKFMPNLLDKDYDNLAYLSLDDFANVDYDDLSDMFKL